MRHRTLPGTTLEVSELCLGTMTWGQQNSEAEAHAQLDYALEHGINFIDTAEMYPIPPQPTTQGRTETYLGSWLARQKRDRIIVASKVAGPGRRPWIRNGRTDLTRDVIAEAVDTSLARLRTDYIDLYQIHWPQRNVPNFGNVEFDPSNERAGPAIDEQVAGMAALVRAGKIRYWGVSNETAWGLCAFHEAARRVGAPPPVTVQNSYSLLSRNIDNGMSEAIFRLGMSVLAYSPLAAGILAGKYRHGARPAAGRFVLFDDHPIEWLFDVDADGHWIATDYDYFAGPEASRGWAPEYIDRLSIPDAEQSWKFARAWTIGEVVTALVGAGLRLEQLTEHPVDWWGGHGDVRPEERGRVPLSFSVVARRAG